jgi:cardiolipin synthase
MGKVILFTLLGIYIVILLRTITTVILDNREPDKTIAWVMVLIFVPLAGLIAYDLIGKNRRKERYLSEKCASQLARKSMLGFYRLPQQDIPAHYAEMIHLFHSQNGALPFPGNHIDIYTEGADMLISLLREIGKASHHIHLQTYIIDDDAVGRLVRDILMDKAREGVEVRLIYDDVGCWKTPKYFFEQMREAGADVRSFLPVRLPFFTSKVNYRNHRKLAVIDGKIGFIGGMNLAMRYVRGTAKERPWRDTHLRIEGSAVYGLQRAFLEDWFFVDRSLVTASKYYPAIEPKADAIAPAPTSCVGTQKSAIIQIVSSSPIGPWRDIMQGLVSIIMRAKKYVYIETPYFLPAEPVSFALQTAALSGVDVRLMLPLHSDSSLMDRASASYTDQVMQAGVQVYKYREGFIHSKLIVSDDMVSTCGSTNMDFRSFEHNLEVNAFIYDENTALRMKEIFINDQRRSQTVSLSRHEKRTSGRRIVNSLIRLLTPLL